MFLSQLSPLILPLLRPVPTLYHATLSEAICPTGLKMLPDGSACHQPCGTVCLRNGCVSRPACAPLMLQLAAYRKRATGEKFLINPNKNVPAHQ